MLLLSDSKFMFWYKHKIESQLWACPTPKSRSDSLLRPPAMNKNGRRDVRNVQACTEITFIRKRGNTKPYKDTQFYEFSIRLSQLRKQMALIVSPVLSNFNTPFFRLEPLLSLVLNSPEFYFLYMFSWGKNEDDATMVETSYKDACILTDFYKQSLWILGW